MLLTSENLWEKRIITLFAYNLDGSRMNICTRRCRKYLVWNSFIYLLLVHTTLVERMGEPYIQEKMNSVDAS